MVFLTSGTGSPDVYLCVLVAQLCLTLCDPIDGSPPGSPVPGILQARTLEWVAFPSPMHESEKWKWSCSVVSDSWRPRGLQPTRLLRPWDFPGKRTGVGCHHLLQAHLLQKSANLRTPCSEENGHVYAAQHTGQGHVLLLSTWKVTNVSKVKLYILLNLNLNITHNRETQL